MDKIQFADLSASYYFVGAFVLAFFVVYATRVRRKKLLQFAQDASLKELLFLEKRSFWRLILVVSSFCFAVLSLMQPHQLKKNNLLSDLDTQTLDEEIVDADEPQKVMKKRSMSEVVFLVDTSASMEIKDTRTQVSRLEYAKEIIEEVITHLDGQNVALYAFTSQVTPLVPPTMDYIFTRMMTKNMEINQGDVAGTDLLEALDYVKKKHLLKATEKQTVVILLTDGGDTYLETLSGEQRDQQMRLILNQLNVSPEQKFQCFPVGLGTLQGEVVPNMIYEGKPVVSSLDVHLLDQISQKTSGHTYLASQNSVLQIAESIAQQIKANEITIEEEALSDQKLMRTSLDAHSNAFKKIRYDQIPLFLALCLLGFELTIPLISFNRKMAADE